jgi:hypothetical protein
MLQELYTWEKMRELDRERRARLPGRKVAATARPSRPLLRRTGRLLTRLGTGLENLGASPPSKAECCEACR